MVPWMQCNSSSSVFTCWGTCECVHVHTRCTDKSPPHPLASPAVARVNVCVCMHNADSSPSCPLSSHIVAHVSVCTYTHGAWTDLHPILYSHMFWSTCECVYLHTWCTDRSTLCLLCSHVVGAHVSVCTCTHSSPPHPLSSHVVGHV